MPPAGYEAHQSPVHANWYPPGVPPVRGFYLYQFVYLERNNYIEEGSIFKYKKR
jgi:hypothetical protein